MKNAWRFLFGCALGVGTGYALTLLLSPGRDPRRPSRPADPPADDQPTQ